jgi:hypothetical protein
VIDKMFRIATNKRVFPEHAEKELQHE